MIGPDHAQRNAFDFGNVSFSHRFFSERAEGGYELHGPFADPDRLSFDGPEDVEAGARGKCH